MKRQVQVYGFAWYSPDAWQRLKAVAVDVNDLDDTYGSCMATVRLIQNHSKRGMISLFLT
jgi:hypothetical protein